MTDNQFVIANMDVDLFGLVAWTIATLVTFYVIRRLYLVAKELNEERQAHIDKMEELNKK